MKKNEGNIDRIIRGVVAVAAVIGSLAVGVATVGGILLLVAAGIMAVTAVSGFCPLYRLVGVDTCPLDSRAS